MASAFAIDGNVTTRWGGAFSAGHWLQVDAPDKVNALLLDFLGEQAPIATAPAAGAGSALR